LSKLARNTKTKTQKTRTNYKKMKLFFCNSKHRMDSGALGALIGIGTMLCAFVSMKLREIYRTRKKRCVSTKPPQSLHQTPIVVKVSPKVIIVKHSTMNKILPPLSTRRLILLSNLGGGGEGGGSRNLHANLKSKKEEIK
jgi:hypothetical protein